MNDRKPTCDTCMFNGGTYVYLDAPMDTPTGLKCVRRSPAVTGGMTSSILTIWPMVSAEDWCGEYIPSACITELEKTLSEKVAPTPFQEDEPPNRAGSDKTDDWDARHAKSRTIIQTPDGFKAVDRDPAPEGVEGLIARLNGRADRGGDYLPYGKPDAMLDREAAAALRKLTDDLAKAGKILDAADRGSPIYKAVERVLDEHSAWIAMPNGGVVKKIALSAGIAWSIALPREASEDCDMPLTGDNSDLATPGRKWVGGWYGSETQRGTSLWELNDYGGRANLLIHFGVAPGLHDKIGSVARIHNDAIAAAESSLASSVAAERERAARIAPEGTSHRKFRLDDRVRKIKGSSWQGRVVGFYTTELTPIGYAVESEREPGSVQIYPEAALERVEDA